ncbi:MAG: UDP-N-acetylmuramate dehydrogenase [Polyangiaceae bacterium]|jgi:UDP-N-acetylmuramate dehydrogenase
MREREQVSLAPLTTLHIGGPARRLIEIEREPEILELEHEMRVNQQPLFVLGGGSNIVVGDEGWSGVVAHVALKGTSSRRDGSNVLLDVAAGEGWDEIVERTVREGWAGLECMSGIPGLVGATPIQNVGAYGQEVSDTIVHVRAFDRAAGAFVTISTGTCGFGYRSSIFKGSDRWMVTSVRFSLDASRGARPIRYAELARALAATHASPPPLRAVRDAVLDLRRSKGMVIDRLDPDSISAGSFFVNPVVDEQRLPNLEAVAGDRPPAFQAGPGKVKVAAAWLVERAGFPKGWTFGPVGLSKKHALALVNLGGATAHELLTAARWIQNGVAARFGIVLQPEPVLVGCSWPTS